MHSEPRTKPLANSIGVWKKHLWNTLEIPQLLDESWVIKIVHLMKTSLGRAHNRHIYNIIYIYRNIYIYCQSPWGLGGFWSFLNRNSQEDELQALLADWTTFSDSCSQKRWNSPEESALLLKVPLWLEDAWGMGITGKQREIRPRSSR